MKKRKDDLQQRLRKAIEQRVTSYLWVEGDTPPFRPALLPKVFGDGRALFALATINQRPRYYVIQGDSSWISGAERGEGPDFGEFTDDILTALEEHFGNGRCGYSGNSLFESWRERRKDCQCEACNERGYRAKWPMVDGYGGCSWGRMDWPEGFDVVPHPDTSRGNLLRARP